MGHLGLKMNQKGLKTVFLDQKSFSFVDIFLMEFGGIPHPSSLHKIFLADLDGTPSFTEKKRQTVFERLP